MTLAHHCLKEIVLKYIQIIEFQKTVSCHWCLSITLENIKKQRFSDIFKGYETGMIWVQREDFISTKLFIKNEKLFLRNFLYGSLEQKQPCRGFLKKRCFENMRQIHRRTPMPKCDFSKVALQLY